MCGISGILHFGSLPDAEATAAAMARGMRHRGPDGFGSFADADMALGFVRLSILDHHGGAQPMANADGSIRVVFNGEIYNHRELRAELEALGHLFRSDHSDTEVLVHGWRQWGTELPAKLNGMFAFAVWDQRDRSLFLARDRYGIKPLYTSRLSCGTLLFASEIRGLLASGQVDCAPNPTAVLEYLSFQNVVREPTVFADIDLFPPATWELCSASGRRRERYWRLRFDRAADLGFEDAVARHRDILARVVERQMAADVPVMTYLSGGIDSSAIAALAQRVDPTLKSYACLFDVAGTGEHAAVDERDYSRAMAKRLGSRHSELLVEQDALIGCLDQVIRALEEPRMGVSYANYLIARRVAADGKVVLSGLGGDELHAGYVYRYRMVRDASRPLRRLARRLRGRPALSGRETFRRLLRFPLAPSTWREALTPDFLATARGFCPDDLLADWFDDSGAQDDLDLVMLTDARHYMHGLLVLEDKLSMASSLETRVPLLDNELVDFVATLPFSHLTNGEVGKRVFRESVRPLVPESVYTKPKMGFGPPDAAWYRGALKPLVQARLSRERVMQRGIFEPEWVERLLGEHFEGRANNGQTIWSLLSLDAWCEVFGLYGGALGAVT